MKSKDEDFERRAKMVSDEELIKVVESEQSNYTETAITINAVSLIKNQYVYGLDETTVKYKLKPEELEPFMDRFFK